MGEGPAMEVDGSRTEPAADEDLDRLPLMERRRLLLLPANRPSPPRAAPQKHPRDVTAESVSSEAPQDWSGLPRGVKFDPSDGDLLWHLIAKVGNSGAQSHPCIGKFISCLDEEEGLAYRHPKNLPGAKQDGSVSYFFHRTFKYKCNNKKILNIYADNSTYMSWHKVGKTKPVMLDGKQQGHKKELVLYMNTKGEKPEKTNWRMHQYGIGTLEEEDGEFVVSKLFYQFKSRGFDKYADVLARKAMEASGQVEEDNSLISQGNSKCTGLKGCESDVLPTECTKLGENETQVSVNAQETRKGNLIFLDHLKRQSLQSASTTDQRGNVSCLYDNSEVIVEHVTNDSEGSQNNNSFAQYDLGEIRPTDGSDADIAIEGGICQDLQDSEKLKVDHPYNGETRICNLVPAQRRVCVTQPAFDELDFVSLEKRRRFLLAGMQSCCRSANALRCEVCRLHVLKENSCTLLHSEDDVLIPKIEGDGVNYEGTSNGQDICCMLQEITSGPIINGMNDCNSSGTYNEDLPHRALQLTECSPENHESIYKTSYEASASEVEPANAVCQTLNPSLANHVIHLKVEHAGGSDSKFSSSSRGLAVESGTDRQPGTALSSFPVELKPEHLSNGDESTVTEFSAVKCRYTVSNCHSPNASRIVQEGEDSHLEANPSPATTNLLEKISAVVDAKKSPLENCKILKAPISDVAHIDAKGNVPTVQVKPEPVETDLSDLLENIPPKILESQLSVAKVKGELNTNFDQDLNYQALPSVSIHDSANTIDVKARRTSHQRKRKRTATDSVEKALEEDAPGLLKVLLDRGIIIEEIKLYGSEEDDEALEILSEYDFEDLENVITKLFSERASLLRLSTARHVKGGKAVYCLACLISLIEQARYLRFRNSPVEWGWCRDLQSFVFVFESHNRIVLERPEYGYATYFFEIVQSLPVDWQIKRIVTAMKLTSCSRTTLIENKPLLVGEDLTEGEAQVLEGYGWIPDSGLGTMLNYCDRVVHDKKNEMPGSEWRVKIGRLLMNGYDGGHAVLKNIPSKIQKYIGDQNPNIKLEHPCEL